MKLLNCQSFHEAVRWLARTVTRERDQFSRAAIPLSNLLQLNWTKATRQADDIIKGHNALRIFVQMDVRIAFGYRSNLYF